jgi:hypothetical protein
LPRPVPNCFVSLSTEVSWFLKFSKLARYVIIGKNNLFLAVFAMKTAKPHFIIP